MILLLLGGAVCYNADEKNIWGYKMRNGCKIAALAGAMLFAFPFGACGENRETFAPFPSETETYLPQNEEPTLPQEEPISPKQEEPIPPQEEPTPPKQEEPVLPQEEPAPRAAKKTYIQTLVSGLNVRAGAGTGYAAVAQAEKGTLLAYAGKSGNWYETYYLGKKAYVSADSRYTALAEWETGDETAEKIIEEGTKLLGTPYVYGAVRLHDGKGTMLKNFTTAQFDCSSLMQYIFYKGAGILLDVTTRTQIKQGEKVEWKDIQRGDLLFFTNASRANKTGIERVGHVALYLGGNYILHTASDFAKIEQITPLRKSYFIEGRRI